MEELPSNDFECPLNSAMGVTNSNSLKNSIQQNIAVPEEENNLNDCDVLMANNITENTKSRNLEVEQTNRLDTVMSNKNSTPNNSGVTCVASQSLLDILKYGSSGSSSEDSEPDSVDLIPNSQCSESSDSDWEEIPSNNDNTNNVKNYRNRCPSSGNTSDSNESLDYDVAIGAVGVVKPIPKTATRTEGELELDELPPVPDLSKLSINVKSEDCIQMGKISNIIDRLVTIESLPNTPAYDLDTLLFLDVGKVPLGYVYDVIGQVTSPIYVVRFNSKEEIESRGITKGLPVYCAPNSEHTQFVFLKELLRLKGSDASWQGDSEVPLEFLDFSDDELEFERLPNNANETPIHARRKKRNSIDRHRIFETTMNLKNEVESAKYKIQEVIVPTPKRNMPKRNFKFHYRRPPASCHVQPSINQAYQTYCSPNFTPNFNVVNVPPPPPMFNLHGAPYTMIPFPPNPQFPPPTFGSPAIPAMGTIPQHMPHFPTQPPPPGYHPGSLPMLPTTLSVAVCKPIPQIPKIHQNTGVVPKIRLPTKYRLPNDYQFVTNAGPHREIHFISNATRSLPSALGSQPYSSVAGAYNITSSNNSGETPLKKSFK